MTFMKINLPSLEAHYKSRVEQALERFLPTASQEPSGLHQAMRYSIFSPGKRLRPILTYCVGEALGASLDVLDYPAATIEMIHAFSLIHDDLPAIDDDDLRRGLPTCHKKFDEATAILAGDALLSLAFRVLAKTPLSSPETVLEMIECLGESVGSQGLIGGEFFDVQAENKRQDETCLLRISEWKTASLIQSAIMLGALTSLRCDKSLGTQLREYGRYLGIAFQIQDDILGVEGDAARLGKPTDSDRRHQKATIPLLQGVNFAKKMRDQFYEQAQDALLKTGLPLKELTKLSKKMILRDY